MVSTNLAKFCLDYQKRSRNLMQAAEICDFDVRRKESLALLCCYKIVLVDR